MKKNMMKQMVVCLVALMAGWAGFGQPASVEAATITVTEAWEAHEWHDGTTYYDLDFTVNNDGYTDIREFAIGNNDADAAWVIYGVSDPPTNLTKGDLAVKNECGWQTYVSGGYRDLTWMDNATGFDDYTKAFLYTSWGRSDSGYDGFLDDGFTNGYFGTTWGRWSPFAAYSLADGTITGDTVPVPIPGAVWLLGSGLLGLVAVSRRKKG